MATQDGERARVLHELHDLATHAVAQIVVHAGVLSAEPAPEERDRSVAAIRRAAASALQDLRRIEALTDGGRSVAWCPQPDIGALADLLDDLRRSGMAREVELDRGEADLAAAVELGAYRLVQRLLEGVRSCHGARFRRVAVAIGEERLVLRASIELPPGGSPAALAGALEPARQRAVLHGGTFSLRRRGDRTLACAAVLPLSD